MHLALPYNFFLRHRHPIEFIRDFFSVFTLNYLGFIFKAEHQVINLVTHIDLVS